MKATVLRSPEIASEVAAEEKAQLPGVRQAEEEFKKDEQKRQQKVKPLNHKTSANAPRKQTAQSIRTSE